MSVVLTADLVGRTVVAAAAFMDFDPARVFVPRARGAGQVRILAAHALVRIVREDGRKGRIGAMLGVDAASMSRRIDPEHVAAVLARLPEGRDLPPLPPSKWGPRGNRTVKANVSTAANAAPAAPPAPIAPPQPVAPQSAPEPVTVAEPLAAKASKATTAHVRPMKANLRRWTRQFLNAGWTPREVARLFDLHIAQVKAVKMEAAHG